MMFMPIVQTILQGALTADQFSKANDLKQEYAKARAGVQATDPQQQALLNSLRQRQLYAESGATKMNALKRTLALQSQAQTNANLVRGAGGNSGALIDSLLRSQNLTQRSLAQGSAETEQLGQQYLMSQIPLVQNMANRRYTLQAYDRDVAAGQYAQAQQNAYQNLNGMISSLGSMNWGGSGSGGGGSNMTMGT